MLNAWCIYKRRPCQLDMWYLALLAVLSPSEATFNYFISTLDDTHAGESRYQALHILYMKFNPVKQG